MLRLRVTRLEDRHDRPPSPRPRHPPAGWRLARRLFDADASEAYEPHVGGPADGAPATQPTGRGGTYKVGNPYQVGGIWYVPHEDPNYDATGVASWYGDQFHMKSTANGETFDMNAISAAHTTLPMPSMVEVTNLENGKKLVVRVNDRGPFVGGRLIDLSHAAARELGYEREGTAKVRVRYLGPAQLGVGDGVRYAANTTSIPGPTTVPAPTGDAMSFKPITPASTVSATALPPVAAAPATSGIPAAAPRTYAAAAPARETWAPPPCRATRRRPSPPTPRRR